MRNALFLFVVATLALTGCKKSSAPAGSAKSGDTVQQKLQELAGSGATDCGRIASQAPDQMKAASDCALQAAQGKRPFYVAYDLPGLTVAVAGNAEGKLFSVNSQKPENAPPEATAEVKSDPCPAELRVAQSGRVTCFAAGSFGGPMGANPHGGAMGANPSGGPNPHGGMTPPANTPNPHGKTTPQPAPQH